jgi:hypothetical protein
MNGSAPAGSGMYVPHALEFRNERVLPARLRRQFAGPRPVAVSADLLKSAGHQESLWPRRRYRSLHRWRWAPTAGAAEERHGIPLSQLLAMALEATRVICAT